MPSFSAIANSAANGWRKLKEETLTYTPPSSEGPKSVRCSPDRKLRKVNVMQYTDLPRPSIKSRSGGKEIQLGLPQSYIRQCETDRFFREHHKHYYSNDSILGLIIISLALETSSTPPTAHGHVFTKCGPMSIPTLKVSADTSCYSAVYHLSEDARSSLAKQAAAIMLLKYFANTPGLVMEEARRCADGGGWGGLGGVCAFDEMHAADIAERCERLKGSDVTMDLKCAMEWRGYDRIFVDIVIPNENEVEDPEGLRDFLALFRPYATSKEEPAPLAPTKPLDITDTDPISRRTHILEELQSTERHFLARMQHLLQDYHTPLKARAKSTDPILNMYQVNTLFPRSLEVIVKAHEAFYEALASAEEHDIPAILFGKFKECYPRFLESRRGSTTILKEQLQNPQFREFVDKQKYQGGLQIGLPELLIDPVQRIPRYSLFLTDLLPVFPSNDLSKALNIIKEIGLMEKRLEDKTSETWSRLKRLIKDLPADLISSSRILLDAIDCVEILPPYSSGASGLQATICVFSDCIMFVKRAYMEQNLSSRIMSEQEDLRIQVGSRNDLTGQSQMHATFRGSIQMDKVRIARSETALWITLLDDLEGKVAQGKWTGRVERRFVPCVRPLESAGRVMDAVAQAKRMARGKVELSGMIEREGGKLIIDWGVVRREQYEEIRQKAEAAVFYVESDMQVAMPYLQCIGAPAVSLSITSKNGEFRLYEDNTVDIPPSHCGDTAYTADLISETLFNQIIETEKVLTAPYAPSNLNAYLTSNTQILDAIHKKTLPPSFPKALASLPTSPSKSLSSFLRSPKKRQKDNVDSIRSSVFDSPSTGSQSQSSDTTSRTTASSLDDGIVIGKRTSLVFLGGDAKEMGPVAGIRSFVEGLRGRDWHGLEQIEIELKVDVEGDLNSLKLTTQKQNKEYGLTEDKYPTRTFAVSGSSTEIAYPALRVFVKEHVIRKMGVLISPDVVARLHIINDMPVSEELKRGRFGNALRGIPVEKSQIIRLLIALLSDDLDSTPREYSKTELLGVAYMLVDESSAKEFIPIIQCIIQSPDIVFEFLQQSDSQLILRTNSQHATQSTLSKSSTHSSGLRSTPSPTKRQSRMSLSSSHNTFGTRSSMSFHQRTQSLRRPTSGTLSSRPISSGVMARRPVTAVDFGGEQPNVSVASRNSIQSENWFADEGEASVCLVVGSDEEGELQEEKKDQDDMLKDLALTAGEYFNKSSGENWWE